MLPNISVIYCQQLNLAKEGLQCQTWPYKPTGAQQVA